MKCTLTQRLDETRGRASGFDVLRLTLAIGVLMVHSVDIAHGLAAGDELFSSVLRPFVRIKLPMFFAISGFLVTASFVKAPGMAQFLWQRALRIYPALVAAVLVFSFVIGPAFTVFSTSHYLTDPLLARYLLNATGCSISFELPGVFGANPHPRTVNTQLWTLPFELGCYLLLVLVATVVTRGRATCLLLLTLLSSAGLFLYKVRAQGWVPVPPGPVSGYLLMSCFLAGAWLYLCRDRMPYCPRLFGLSLAASLLLLGVVPGGDHLAALPVAYATVYLGLRNPRRGVYASGARFSYGIYLYGFAVQQAVASVGWVPRVWYLNFALGGLITLALAVLSYHLVEAPALRRLKTFAGFRRPVAT